MRLLAACPVASIPRTPGQHGGPIALASDILSPRVFGTVLKLPALVTVVAILIGAALLGLVGALVALPIAAALMLLTQEMLFVRLDRGSA